jgi:hypothetical protein
LFWPEEIVVEVFMEGSSSMERVVEEITHGVWSLTDSRVGNEAGLLVEAGSLYR